MCGIAGKLGAEDGAAELIDVLKHRGPNGVRVEQGKNSSLAHARLSIIDLEGGWQPLHAAGSTIIGNGEIYNYRELTRDFGLQNVLKTGSDFEPLLHIYAREGERVFERLRGMYAFCLIGADGRTWLVRDPFGIKPLYVKLQDGVCAFASEPRAFGPAQAQPTILREVASLNYALRKETAWPEVTRLQPGVVMEFKQGALHQRDKRSAIPKSAQPPADEEEALTALDRVLEDSVSVHQRSDVPYGLFLSGGIDSATIATLMARLNERAVIAYTCGFDAPEARDERAAAESVAKALKLDWRETLFTEEDFWTLAPQVAWAMDDPVADYACLPTMKLAAAAKESLTVVLSGEGGDELFAGYGRYRRALRPKWMGGRPAEPQIDSRTPGAEEALAAWRAASASPSKLSPLQQAQWADIATWLPNDLLLKLDRCLMAHGLEGRTPFLDPEVAAFAFYLPDDLKVRGRYGKYILRKWLERHCPAAEPWAKKRGFTVPVASWIAPRAAQLSKSLADVESVRAVCDADTLRAVFNDDALESRRWPLLFLGLWGRIHVEGATPEAALRSLIG
jgi:asparagine synthase (glutamine-hydrolysing)